VEGRQASLDCGDGKLTVHRTACMKNVLLYTDFNDQGRNRLGRRRIPQGVQRIAAGEMSWVGSGAILLPRTEVKKRGLRPCKHCYRWGRDV